MATISTIAALAGSLTGNYALAPNIGVPPVVANVGVGGLVTYTPASGVTGFPTPTVTYDLYKNGTLFMANYVSGSYTATTAGDLLHVTATAANGVSPNDIEQSPDVTVTAVYTVTLTGFPVRGKPLGFTTTAPGGVTVTSQQWYMNAGAGAGPIAVGGATAATYSPVIGDDNKWPSVHLVFSDSATAHSFEFTNQTAIVNAGTLQTTGSPSTGGQSGGSAQFSFTLYEPTTFRAYYTSYYVDNDLAPGTYPAYSTLMNSLLLPPPANAPSYAINYSYRAKLGVSACAPQIAAAAATATRPAASTGVGFFIKGGELYDANGNRFRMRGLNVAHADSTETGIYNTKCNMNRWVCLQRYSPTFNASYMANCIAHSCIPMPSFQYTSAQFTATISGNTLTVSVFNTGAPNYECGLLYPGLNIPAGAGYAAFQITGYGTATGRDGTYTIDNAQTVASPTFMTSESVFTTTHPTTDVFNSAIQIWVDRAAFWKTYERQSMINPLNEWGPLTTSGSTVWRDSWAAGIPLLRAAGYLGTIVIDAPGSGQDINALTTQALYILQHDPQLNVIFDFHVYQNGIQGNAQHLISQLSAATAASLSDPTAGTQGLVFAALEFGPGRGVSSTYLEPLELIAACEANQIGWAPWVWDNPGTGATNFTFAMAFNAAAGGYATSNPADLTIFGGQTVLDATYGMAVLAVPATVFP